MLNRDFSYSARRALPCVFSVEGLELSDSEISLFKQADPIGFILFKRNCDNKKQVTFLVKALKELVGRDCPVLIDQEGGRVARLRPPNWGEHKPMAFYGQLYEEQGEAAAIYALESDTLRLAKELVELGINVNCAPVLDLFFEGAHDIIGDRAFGSNPEVVSKLGEVVCRTFLDAGVTPIIKHIPGHGRALSDSHMELPHVTASMDDLFNKDFRPFRNISSSVVGRSVWAMSAHMTYEALRDDMPVSLSKNAVNSIIREHIGFDGVLICDDLDMKALDQYGSVSQKAVKALDAGCDLALYCAGEIEKMEELAENLSKISDKALKRLGKSEIS